MLDRELSDALIHDVLTPARTVLGTFARAFPNDAELPGLGRPGASPSGFDLVGLAADLVTPARCVEEFSTKLRVCIRFYDTVLKIKDIASIFGVNLV